MPSAISTRLVSRLNSNARVQSFEMDPELFARRNQPRPRHTFVLLDRPMPQSGAGINARRRTAARRRHRNLRAANRSAGAIGTLDRQRTGVRWGDPRRTERNRRGYAWRVQRRKSDWLRFAGRPGTLNWRWHMPRDTSPDLRRRLIEEERREAIIRRWPKLPQPVLQGKSPLEAAGDAELRIPLMASVLILEQASNSGSRCGLDR